MKICPLEWRFKNLSSSAKGISFNCDFGFAKKSTIFKKWRKTVI